MADKLSLDTKIFLEEANSKAIKSIGKLNAFAYPKIDYISINVGVGKFENKDKDEIANYLYKLTSQKPKKVKTNKSISGFNLRSGAIVGLQATLRGQKMYDFLLNLIYIALPRGRDFKGVSTTAFDKTLKTYSLGIRTAGIFPVIGFDIAKDFGLQVNIVFKAGTKNNQVLLESLNFPFSK
ncbi:MAG: 50S ribosomal protein L5 [bacterium]